MDGAIIIDAREACRPRRTGKGQWTYGFVTELLRRGVQLTLFTDADCVDAWQGRCRVVRIPGTGFRWHRGVLQRLREHAPSALYVSPTSYIVPAFIPPAIRCIPIVHDLIAFRGEPHQRRAMMIERLLLPRALRKASRVCTVSDATRDDLHKRFPQLHVENTTAIYAGPSHPHPAMNVSDDNAIVCIGTLCPRKNQHRLIEAYSRLPRPLRDAYRLILAGGRGWQDAHIVELAEAVPGVRWLGHVDASEYEYLLHHCTVFALPSLYEGFGMQILDALQRGIPVLTSNRGSLREVAEGAALIVDPENTFSIAKGLEQLLTDTRLRGQLREKARQRATLYSWERTVDLFLATL